MHQKCTAVSTPSEFGGNAASRRPDIQGLRAIAVLMVVAYHAGLPVPGGFVGVDVFFVISGFVITAMLNRELGVSGKLRFAEFYIRRFKRLTPALAFMVTATVFASALLLAPTGSLPTAAKTAIGATLFAGNLVIARTTGGYFDEPAEANPLLHTWSLSVEEQFYFAFPLILALLWLFSHRARLEFAPLLTVALMAAASFGLAVGGSSGHESTGETWLTGFYSPLTRAWEFSAGALVALAGNITKLRSHTLASTLGYTGLTALAASLWVLSENIALLAVWTLLPVIGTSLLIVAGSSGSNAVTRSLSTRPMVQIGDWSYSIYLWHWPPIVFASVLWPGSPRMQLGIALLSFLPALVSYYFVEQPIRSLPSLRRRRIVQLVLTTIGIPLICGGVVGAAARTMFWNEQLLANMTAIQDLPTGWKDPVCISRIPVSARDTKACQWQSSADGVPVYLIGDSNAMHFSEALKSAGEALRRPVTALGTHGCPLIDVYLKREADPALLEQCRENYLALMNWIKHQPRGLVMIASVDRYWRDKDYLVSADGNFKAASTDHNAEALNAGLSRTVRELQEAGHSIILLQTIPHFIADPYRLKRGVCSGWQVITRSCDTPSSEIPIDVADEWQSASRNGIQTVSSSTGARVFDLRNFFCKDGTCSTRHASGTDLYMLDGYHLNRVGSAMLKDAFVTEISNMSTPVDNRPTILR